MHDPLLRDNPPAPLSNRPRTRPFDFQLHVNNQSHPDIPGFLERLRALIDGFGECFTVAEVGGLDAGAEMHAFTAESRRLDSAYGFDFLYADELTPAVVREAVERWPDTPGTGWPSWAFENHDAPRAVSRWTVPENARAFVRMKVTLLSCLRGNIFLYYGEELGLTQVEIPFEHLRDPEAIANWPLTLSRDGARVPMPWVSTAPALGFTTAAPWLPQGADYPGLAVDVQEIDPRSLLHATRAALAFRNAHRALLDGSMTIVEASSTLLVFDRECPGERLRVAVNFAAVPCAWPGDGPWRVIERINGGGAGTLGGFGVIVAEWTG